MRTEDVPPGAVSIDRAIADMLQIVEPEAARRGIKIDCEPAFSATVRSAPITCILQQVLLNLALNGMDAMKDVAAGRRRSFGPRRSAKPRSKLRCWTTERAFRRAGQEIFDSFVTTKQHGTGLGLSIARTIVEMYGGRIWAENRKDGGAAFRFVLPLARSAA